MSGSWLNDDVREVLVVGNGFDVAQGLPTRYMDFMDFLRIADPVTMISRAKAGLKTEKNYNKFLLTIDSVDFDEIDRMKELQENNAWVDYFLNCKAEIKGWIDLEREMIPVFDFFKWLFIQDKKMAVIDEADIAEIVTTEEWRARLALILPKFIRNVWLGSSKNTIVVHEDYCEKQYGVFKEKILDTLKKDLDDFIKIFRIYLCEIACNVERPHDTIIDRIKADQIISFNYLQSELSYDNLKDAETIHVHGDITSDNNMVLGVNEVEDDLKNDFLYFTKSFQRIKIKSNPNYREFWEGEFNVSFFGHSLDVTDVDIIKPLYEKAKHVKVYYYKPRDYEDKIINLIKMVGVTKIENDIYNGRLQLIPST